MQTTEINLSHILSTDRVILDCSMTSKKRALELLSKLLAEGLEETLSHKDILASFVARENLGSTYLGHGIGLPHARFDELTEAKAAILRLHDPIVYDDQDELKADILFALIVPAADNEANLQLLSSIAERLREPGFREQIRDASDAEDVYRLFS